MYDSGASAEEVGRHTATRRDPVTRPCPSRPTTSTVVAPSQPGAGSIMKPLGAMRPSKAPSTAVGSGGEAGPPVVALDWKTCRLTCRHKAAQRGKPDLSRKPA
jgi:hypothetical protein